MAITRAFQLCGPGVAVHDDNGAGKTTTICMISGLLRPDDGTVLVEGHNLSETPRVAKRLLGLVPQDLALYEEFSARENLLFWGSLYGIRRSELKRNAEEILDRVGLADRAREPVDRYSGGMKRRLNLAIGLVHRPKLLLLEENWDALGPKLQGKLHIVVGELDTFYLEGAVKRLAETLRKLESNAQIEIIPGKDHFNLPTADCRRRFRRQMSETYLKHYPEDPTTVSGR